MKRLFEFDKVNMGFAIQQIIRNENWEIVDLIFSDVNPYTCRLLGLTREEILGKGHVELFGLWGHDWENKVIVAINSMRATNVDYYSERFQKYLRINVNPLDDNQLFCVYNDITTEQEQADEINYLYNILLQSQKQGKTGTVVREGDGNIFWASDSALEMYGIRKFAEGGNRIHKDYFLNSRLTDRNQSLCADGAVEDKPYDQTFWIKTADKGEKKLIHSRINKEINEDNKNVKYIATLRDITSEYEQHHEVVENEVKFRAVFENTPVGIALFDSEACLIDVNRAMMDIVGVEAIEDYIGMNCLNDPNLDNRVKEMIEKGEDGVVAITQFEKSKNMETRYLDMTVKHYSVSEKKAGFLMLAQDRTADWENRKKISEISERLRITLDAVGDGVISVDRSSRVQNMNARARKLTGWISEDAYNRRIEEVYNIVNTESGNRISSSVVSVLIRGKRKEISENVNLISKDGSVRRISCNFEPLYTKGGGVVGVVITFRDITDLERQKNIIQQNNLELNYYNNKIDRILKGAEIIQWDLDCRTGELHYNSVWEKYIGSQKNSKFNNILGAWFDKIHIGERHKVERGISELINGKEERLQSELRMRNLQGDFIWYLLKASAIERDESGEVTLVSGMLTKIHDLKETETNLRNSERRLSTLMNNAASMMLQVDLKGEIVFATWNFHDLVGQDRHHLEETRWIRYIHKEDREKMTKLWVNTYKKFLMYPHDKNPAIEEENYEICRLKHLGDDRYFEWRCSRYYEEENKKESVIFVIIEVTNRIRQERKIEYLAYYDQLTNLYNRSKMIEEMEWIFNIENPARSYHAVGIFFDLDNFKTVNDLYGHQMGDQYLKSVALSLKKVFGKEAVCARLSGDEFYILLKGMHEREKIGEKVQAALDEISEINLQVQENQEITVNASAGIVTYPDDVDNVTDMIAYADVAMLQAKQKGRNCFIFYNGKFTAQYYKNFQLLQDLKKAIKNEELILYYQPIINGKTGEVVELEALLRWLHPEYGIVGPGEFIYVAELSGEIVNIGKQVFMMVCKQLQSWHKAGFHNLKVSINLSALQLNNVELVNDLMNAAFRYNIDPASINLEVTETLILQETDIAKVNVNRLKTCGFKLSLDDFGVEYSSLAMLERIEFDIIKIDRFFTQSLSQSFVSKTVVEMIHKIITGLGKQCIVEGVETEKELELILGLGFQYIQGFYFSKPLHPEQVTDYLLENVNKE
jgi:diguanylate cyclase (GGDEF)-like protein/PAS domain S-box-containing protein